MRSAPVLVLRNDHGVDSRIRVGITTTLALLGQIDHSRITVAVRHGVVALTGSVRCWSEWHIVERVAWSCPDIVAVHNDLVIAYPEC